MIDTSHQTAISDLPIREAYYSAIGRFMVEFSRLEGLLQSRVAGKIGIAEKYQEKIMTHDFSMICTIASQVLDDGLSPKDSADLQKLISRCRAANNDRVRIAHGWWILGYSKTGLQHVPRTKLVADTHYKKPIEVAQIADEIHELRIDLVSHLAMIDE